MKFRLKHLLIVAAAVVLCSALLFSSFTRKAKASQAAEADSGCGGRRATADF